MAMREKEMATQESVSNYQHQEIIRSLLTHNNNNKNICFQVCDRYSATFCRKTRILWEFAINEVNNVYCSYFPVLRKKDNTV